MKWASTGFGGALHQLATVLILKLGNGSTTQDWNASAREDGDASDEPGTLTFTELG